MSSRDLRDKKKFLIILIGVLCIIIAAAIALSPSRKGPGEGPVVLASERVKVDLAKFDNISPRVPDESAETQKAPVAPTPQTAPSPQPKPEVKAAKAPEPEVKTPAPRPEEKRPVVATKAPAKKTASAKTVKAELHWAINVASFTDRPSALKLRDRLNAAGFNAYTTEFVKDGTRWSRVRVGFYPTRTEAEKAGSEIVKKLRIRQKPWVVRPPSGEIREHAG